MSLFKKVNDSILFKFEVVILGILIIFFIFFLWHLQNTEYKLFDTIYHTRKKYIISELNKNLKENVRTRLHLIKANIQKHKKELTRALFTVDSEKCRKILSYLSAFPSIKAVILFDSLVRKPFLIAIKSDHDQFVFTSRIPLPNFLSLLRVELEDPSETHKKIGYIKIFYDPTLFNREAKRLQKEELNALEREHALAEKMLRNNLKKQILSLLFIFSILYIVLHVLFSKIINQPIKKLEHNLKNFFNFLADKDDEITLDEIKTSDEFGRMGKFINDGIKTSVEIHQELEKRAKEISKLATVLEQSVQSILITDLDGNIEYANKAFENVTGYTFNEIKGKNPRILKSGYHTKEFYEELWETITSGRSWQGIFTNKKKDGSLFYERAFILPVKNENGDTINYAAIKQDITKERILEQQLQQVQKMKSIGTLAGGIAHDFNNLLTVINGSAELTLFQMKNDDSLRNYIVSILEASKKAKILTSQLLAFSRKQVYHPEVTDINHVIASMEKMVRRLINEDILIETRLTENIPKIKADVSQLEQIFVNLIINARDALNAFEHPHHVKKITIQTGKRRLDQDYVSQHPGSQTGYYVFFSISDNGIGMNETTIQRIFEPFFTTKEKHKGTGLGLSTVYGIVKQNKGYINVHSEPGKGTTFKIYWPVSEEQRLTNKNKPIHKNDQEKLLRGNETILVVEDGNEPRRFAKKALLSLGYTVHTAKNGREALALLENGLKVDLIFTDLIMPEMNGREFAEKAQREYHIGKVIYVSGYTDDHISHNGMLDEDIRFIPKPYSIKTLSFTIRRVLDEA